MLRSLFLLGRRSRPINKNNLPPPPPASLARALGARAPSALGGRAPIHPLALWGGIGGANLRR
jgi:hypothetical protein